MNAGEGMSWSRASPGVWVGMELALGMKLSEGSRSSHLWRRYGCGDRERALRFSLSSKSSFGDTVKGSGLGGLRDEDMA